METMQKILEIDLPYRMAAVDTLMVALRLRERYSTGASMEVLFDGQLVIEGNSNGWLNPAFESGVMHGRALLEFLGLTESNGKLVAIAKRRPTDVYIEQLGLSKVSPSEAVSAYTGPQAEAERALVTLISTANKGVAHSTSALQLSSDQASMLYIAARGIPALVERHVYRRLGVAVPSYQVPARTRAGC